MITTRLATLPLLAAAKRPCISALFLVVLVLLLCYLASLREGGVHPNPPRRVKATHPLLSHRRFRRVLRSCMLLLSVSSTGAYNYTFDTGCVTSTSVCDGWVTGPTSSNGLPSGSTPYGWHLQSGKTLSGSTGPTSGYGGSGSYYFIETSYPQSTGDVYELTYSGCPSSGDVVQAVSFRYHMYGATTG